jgi:hypothetical protein
MHGNLLSEEDWEGKKGTCLTSISSGVTAEDPPRTLEQPS